MKYAITLPALCFILFTLACLRVTAAAPKTFPAAGTMAHMRVDTMVDSPIAGHIINGTTSQLSPELRQDLYNRLACQPTGDIPDLQSLQQLTEDYSPDTATALLIRCLFEIEQVRLSQTLFVAELKKRRAGSAEQADYLSARADQYMVLFVPGWGYLSSGDETGSNLRTPQKIIAAMGFENHLIDVADNGSVEGNARYLVQALQRHLQTKKKIILVSASSGGPTVAMALQHPAVADHPQLVGWLNICGVLNGSPVIDKFRTWPGSLVLRAIVLYEGWEYSNLLSLSQHQSQPRYAGFVLPTQLTVVNYIGIPFSSQISEFGRDFYGMLKARGPNDGLTFITEALAPGYTVMAVGSDHFIAQDPDIDARTAALLPLVLKLIEG